MDDMHGHVHSPNGECKCKSNVASQSLDEMDFQRGIWTAALDNDLDRVKMFIGNNQQNATDNSGYTALHYASRSGHYEICQLLLLAGADVNAKTKSGHVTPLMRAATIGHEQIVKLLLRHNADIKICDNDGNTALHRAIQSGHTTIAQTLKEHEPPKNI